MLNFTNLISFSGKIQDGFLGTKKISGENFIELDKILASIDASDFRNEIFVSTQDDNFRLVRGKWYHEEKTVINDEDDGDYFRRREAYAHGMA